MNDNRRGLDSLTRFERLASSAAAEAPLLLDVSDIVMTTLRSRPITRLDERELVYVGAGSLVAASLAGIGLWLGSPDDSLLPLAQLFLTVLP